MALDTTQPGRPVVDYDHHSAEYAQRAGEIQRQTRETCPVAWSESHGGFWVVTGYEATGRIARDDATFSSEHDFDDPENGRGGVGIPPVAIRAVPLELDPPENLLYRRAMTPRFSPTEVETWEPFVDKVTHACIDEVIESGEIDFVEDLTGPVTGRFVTAFLGLPEDEWAQWAQPPHDTASYAIGTPEYDRGVVGWFWMVSQLLELVPKRRANPENDLISHLTQIETDDGPIPDQRIVETMLTVIGGGVDTTMAVMCHALHWLSEHPEQRQRLIDDPTLIPSAREEFLRAFSPVVHLARTVTTDVELEGQQLCAGDRLLICWPAANRDPAEFDQPDEVDLDRFPNRHLAFGVGGHRCPGSNFARTEFDFVLRAILQRMPDFVVDTDQSQRYEAQAIGNGWVRMPATFTPGLRRPQQPEGHGR